MRRSTKYLIKESARTVVWVVLGGFMVWLSLKGLPAFRWLAGVHVVLILMWVWSYAFAECSAIGIWRLMRRNEDLDKRYGVLA